MVLGVTNCQNILKELSVPKKKKKGGGEYLSKLFLSRKKKSLPLNT